MTQKRTKAAQVIVDDHNKRILRLASSEERMAVFSFAADLLMALGQYRGYQYAEWKSWGCAAWEAAGKPNDTEPYIGDPTVRLLY